MSSKIFLCQVKRADEPYYIEDINRYLYSIEELCWFIDHNLALVDDGFFDTTLTDWIRGYLQLPELADRMDHIMSGGSDEEEPADEAAFLTGIADEDGAENGADGHMLERLIYVVNAEISWMYVPDRQAFRREIAGIRHLSTGERMKRRADTLISYGKYTRALQVYKRIIRDAEEEGLLKQYIGAVSGKADADETAADENTEDTAGEMTAADSEPADAEGEKSDADQGMAAGDGAEEITEADNAGSSAAVSMAETSGISADDKVSAVMDEPGAEGSTEAVNAAEANTEEINTAEENASAGEADETSSDDAENAAAENPAMTDTENAADEAGEDETNAVAEEPAVTDTENAADEAGEDETNAAADESAETGTENVAEETEHTDETGGPDAEQGPKEEAEPGTDGAQEKNGTDDRTAILCGTVWHNMGVAYARLFQFDEACVCMKRAYNLLHSNEILRDYLCCVLISRGEETFEDLADRLGADTVTRAEIRSNVESIPEKKAPANIDEALNTWVREYHRQTAP